MCHVSRRFVNAWMLGISIVVLVMSITVLVTAITALTSPFMIYVGMNLYGGINMLVIFAFMIATGVLGICGIKRKRLVCVYIMFWFLLFSVLWCFGMAYNMAGVYYLLASKENANGCSARTEQVLDLSYLGDTVGPLLCTATCPCSLASGHSIYTVDSTI